MRLSHGMFARALSSSSVRIKASERDAIPIQNIHAGSPTTPAGLPAFLLFSRPDRLPERAVDITLEEMDVPVAGLLQAGVARQS